MKFLYILIILLALTSCKESVEASAHNSKEELINSNDDPCTLKVDTFSFKGIKIGMDIHKLSGIKISKYPQIVLSYNDFCVFQSYLDKKNNLSHSNKNTEELYGKYIDSIKKTNVNYIYSNQYTNEVSSISNVKTYEVSDKSKYHIFETPIDKIYLRFYNDKLFHIYIILKKSIVTEIAEKFASVSCIKENSINLENDKLFIRCENIEYGCFLNVSDVIIDKLLNSQTTTQNKKENKKLDDF